jgi:hypothetical protein
MTLIFILVRGMLLLAAEMRFLSVSTVSVACD